MSYMDETVSREIWTMSGNCDPQYTEIEVEVDKVVDIEGDEPYHVLRYFSANKGNQRFYYDDGAPSDVEIERRLCRTEGRDWAMRGTIAELGLGDEDDEKEIQYTVCSRTLTLRMQGDRVEDYEPPCDEDVHGDFDSLDEAVAAADEIASAPDAVKLIDQRGRGIGAIDHVFAWVDASYYDAEADEYVSCDAKGEPCGMYVEPVYAVDALDGQPKLKAAWDKAVKAKLSWLDYEAEECYTVRAFLDESGEE